MRVTPGRSLARGAALAALALVAIGCRGGTFVFPDLTGPDAPTTIAPSVPAKPEDFDRGTNSRLAVLVTDTDSSWLGLAHGLRSIGIPARFTRNLNTALEHRVVILYPADASVRAFRDSRRVPSSDSSRGAGR